MPLRFREPLLFRDPLPVPVPPVRTAAGSRCAVCHGTDVVEDEVFDDGILLLGECRRCEHRWTARPVPTAHRARPVRVRSGEPVAARADGATEGVASAA